MTATIERRSRTEFLALTGRAPAPRATFVSRPLSADQQEKIARAIALKARRDAMTRIRLAVASIEAELKRRDDRARSAYGGADPDYLLGAVRSIRADLAALER